MKEFVGKLIQELKEESIVVDDDTGHRAVEIIEQLAEEYINCSTNISTDKSKINDNDLMIVESLPSLYPMKEFEEEALQRVIGCAKKEYNNGWIPCSERLPECENGCETKALMFQMKDTGSIKCGYYGEGGFYRDKYFRTYTNSTNGFDVRDVIAWMPLPAPFKKGSE